MFWSLFLNTATLIVVSLLTSPSALERVQAALFVDLFRASASGSPVGHPRLGHRRDLLLRRRARPRRRHVPTRCSSASPAEPPPQFIDRLERELAGSIGAASAHVMLSKVVSGDAISIEEVFEMAGETRQAIEYSQELERTSAELRSTAAQLENANRKLRELDGQKDEFLSQVSHEVRTPMASIRSFSEILLEDDTRGRAAPALRIDHSPGEPAAHQAARRNPRPQRARARRAALGECSDRRRGSARPGCRRLLGSAHSATCACVSSVRERSGARVEGEADRLCQVLINLISNAINYNDASDPVVEISSRVSRGNYVIDIADNGPGILKEQREMIFKKFTRGEQSPTRSTSGTGLGLAISRQIITRMNGKLDLISRAGRGARFRITLRTSEPYR